MRLRRCRSRSCRRSQKPTTSSSPGSAAPASSPSAASSAWRPISRARALASSTWPVWRKRGARSSAICSLPSERLKRAILADAGRDKTHFIDATRAATALFGNSIGANIFLVGYAYQLGAIPLSAASITQAIELNGEAVEMNQAAFHWGRRAACEPAAVEALIKPAAEAASDARSLSQSFDEMVARRVAFLTAYQDAAYAARYRRWVDKAKAA